MDVGPQYKTLWLWSWPGGHVWVASWLWEQYGSPALWNAASQLAWFCGPTDKVGLVVIGARFSPKARS